MSPWQRSIIATTFTIADTIVLPLGLYALAVNGYAVLMAMALGLIIGGILVGKAGMQG